jgi:hypothetical protein
VTARAVVPRDKVVCDSGPTVLHLLLDLMFYSDYKFTSTSVLSLGPVELGVLR